MNISVIIPTYNRAQFLGRAIDCIMNQEGIGNLFNISEIVIADDCSSDSTEDIVSEFIKRNPLIKYCKTAQNAGPSGARNEGFKHTTSNWIALFDSDDMWYPDKLAKQVHYINNNPNCGIVYHGIKVNNYDGSVSHVPLDEENRIYLSGKIYLPLLIKNFIGAPTMLISREAWTYSGGFDEAFRHLEDWDFALRVAKSYTIGFVDELLMEANMLDGGVSSSIMGWYESRCLIIKKNKTELMESGLFKQVIKDVLVKAQSRNMLDEIADMLDDYLSQ